MYICKECGALFKAPNIELIGVARFTECPYCRSNDITQTRRCEFCNEWITGKYVVVKDSVAVCEDCYEIEDIRE